MEQPASNPAKRDAGLLPPGETFAVWQLAKLLWCHRNHLVHLIEEGELVALICAAKAALDRHCVCHADRLFLFWKSGR